MKLQQFGYMIIGEGTMFLPIYAHRNGGSSMAPNELVVKTRALRERYMWNGIVALLPEGWESQYDEPTRALLHMERGAALFHLEGWRRAKGDFAAGYALVHAVPDPVDACWWIQAYAWTLGQMGDYERGIPMIRTTLSTYRPTGVQLGYLLWNIGEQLYKSGECEEGLNRLYESMSVMLQCGHGDVFCVGVQLAQFLDELDRPNDALRVLSEVEVLLIVRNEHWQARFKNTKAKVLAALKRVDEALAMALDAYQIAGKCGEMGEQSQALLTAAQLPGIPSSGVRTLSDFAVDLSVCAKRGNLLNTAMAILRGRGSDET